MKSRDFRALSESMDFSVSKQEVDTEGKTINNMNHFGERQPTVCWVCDGSGKDPHYDEAKCEYCRGKGKYSKFVSTAPEMNVSNPNAFKILDMIGLNDGEYTGMVEHKDLPVIIRRLLQLKNSDTSQYTSPGSDTQGQMQTGKDDDGMDTIGRSGPRMIDFGVSDSQVIGYVDTLLKIFTFAQKNDADVSWG
jgi:hypothetical protein